MTQKEKKLIDNIFNKLSLPNSNLVDKEARDYIKQKISEIPDADYKMTQALVMQNIALKNFERMNPDKGNNVNSSQINSPEFQQRYQRSGFGGFMMGAAQTAVGIAGGFIIGNAIMGLFDGSSDTVAASSDQPLEENVSNQEEVGDQSNSESFLDESMSGLAGEDVQTGFETAGYDSGGVDNFDSMGDFGGVDF